MYCSFNTTWTSMDLGLMLLHYEIEEPKVRQMKVEIPFRNGSLDLLPYVSPDPVFANRKITMRFETKRPRSEWPELISGLFEKFSGKVTKVVFSTDIDNYWSGMCTVGRLIDKTSTAEITITIDAFPYKRKVIESVEIIDFEYNAGSTLKNITVSDPVAFINTIGVNPSPALPLGARVTIVLDDKTTLFDWVLGGDELTAKGLVIQGGTHSVRTVVLGVSQATDIQLIMNLSGGAL